MPNPDQVKDFYARAETWTGDDIARNNRLADAVSSITWVNDEPPATAEEYQARIATVIAAAESCGYTVVHDKRPAHHSTAGGVVRVEPYTEWLNFYNGTSPIHGARVRFDRDVSGLLAAEGWVRAEVHEKSRQEARKKRLEEGTRRLDEELARGAQNAEIHEDPSKLADRLTVLENKFGVVVERLEYLTKVLKAGGE